MKNKEIAAGKFKATCLALLDEVNKTGEEIVVTKYGKPVAKVVPVDLENLNDFKSLENSVNVKGEIIAPLEEEDWNSFI